MLWGKRWKYVDVLNKLKNVKIKLFLSVQILIANFNVNYKVSCHGRHGDIV